MKAVRWGIIGPGSIARNFADGLMQCQSGTLTAIASRSPDRRDAFGTRYGIPEANRLDSYAALCAADIDAVYIATPHPSHADLAVMAIRAGKAVLVEKPAGVNAAEVKCIVHAAKERGGFFMEGYMYRCHPQIARLVALIGEGAIGELRHVRSRFGFDAGADRASRLFDPEMAGGGILDVGGYPMSVARLIAGVAAGLTHAEPLSLTATGVIGATGVDERAHATLTFAGGITADIACAITQDMDNALYIEGTGGTITVPDPWTPGRDAGPSDAVIRIETGGATRAETLRDPRILFAHEAEMASRAIADGLRAPPAPAMGWADSIGNAEALEAWRRALG